MTIQSSTENPGKDAGQVDGKRARAALKMKAAFGFARSGLGQTVMQARAVFNGLGAFGAALLALYPVAAVLAIAVAGFLLSGAKSPA